MSFGLTRKIAVTYIYIYISKIDHGGNLTLRVQVSTHEVSTQNHLSDSLPRNPTVPPNMCVLGTLCFFFNSFIHPFMPLAEPLKEQTLAAEALPDPDSVPPGATDGRFGGELRGFSLGFPWVPSMGFRAVIGFRQLCLHGRKI